jgi:hypothetical protein
MKLPIRSLKTLSLLFLVFPVYVFLLAWVKLWIALPVSVLLLYAIWQYLLGIKAINSKYVSFNKYHLIGILILCLLWMSLSGIGGFGLVLHDNYKIYAIIKDVMEKSWPVEYMYEGQHYYLSAYLSFFITAPIVMGWLSYDAVNVFLFIYSMLGVLISLIWFAVLSKNRLVFGTLFFILIGGFDIAGFLYQNGIFAGFEKIFQGEFIQFYWWNSIDLPKYLLYHGNTNALFWAPGHAIPCWVASGLFFYDFMEEKNLTFSPIYLFPLVSWSPFMLVGLFPYFIYLLFKTSFSEYLKLQNFLIIPAFLILVWFVTSVSFTELDKGLVFFPLESVKGFLKDGVYLIWFILFEVILWFVFIKIFLSKKEWKENQSTLILLLAVLICIPFYKFGKYNDWVQRVSMPSLFLLWVFVLRAFDSIKNRGFKMIAVLVIFLASADSLSYLKLSALETNGLSFDNHAVPYDEIKSLPQASVENGWVLDQFAAKGEPSFFKYIAKQKKVLE